jgi:hypothetical protein
MIVAAATLRVCFEGARFSRAIIIPELIAAFSR